MDTRRFRLRQLAVIRVSGEQCNAFLQGQLSSDLRELTSMRAQISSLNTAKGRVLAVPQLARLGGDILLVVPSAIAPNVVETLLKYVLRMKVQIAVDPGLACIGIAGPGADKAFDGLGNTLGTSDWACWSGDDHVAWRIPGEHDRILIAGKSATIDKLYGDLSAIPEGDLHLWRWLDVLSKIPEILPPTQDKFVAQMLALDELGAIDFNKGCYTGQEVIARAHYLGKVKRACAVGATPSKRPLKPGEFLKVDGKSAAIVVSAAPHPEAGQSLLAVMSGKFPPGTMFKASDGVEVVLEVGGDPSTIHSLTLRMR
jgi:tRNA-modifying protein YgfZ